MKINANPDEQVIQLERIRHAESTGMWNAVDLLNAKFPAIKYIVPGYLPEGLTILAGKPKIGKSWWCLDLALAVSMGGYAMGSVLCAPGDVLYCALEDNTRRLQSRLRQIMPKDADPKRLTVSLEWPKLDNGGLVAANRWCDRLPEPRPIIFDTLQRVRGRTDARKTHYQNDYEAMTSLHTLANDRGLAVLVVHHATKHEADDALDEVSGTLGLTGACDTVLVLKRDPSAGFVMHGRGRDVSDIEQAFSFDQTNGRWIAVGEASAVRRSDERNQILEILSQADDKGMSAKFISEETGVNANNIYQLLRSMALDGEVIKLKRGLYARTDKAG